MLFKDESILKTHLYEWATQLKSLILKPRQHSALYSLIMDAYSSSFKIFKSILSSARKRVWIDLFQLACVADRTLS